MRRIDRTRSANYDRAAAIVDRASVRLSERSPQLIDRPPRIHSAHRTRTSSLRMRTFDLPLVYATGIELSDLTARFFLKPVGEDAMVLVLLDIHVM
jgi:hypothetical protein